jgi:single-stranded DNA-specific DHH superfamily exonuclease
MANETISPRPEKKMTVLEQIKKLDEQRSKLLESAKAEALKKAEEAVAELNEIGFTYRLVEGDGASPKKKGSRAGAGTVDPAKPCSVCNFLTTPNHDARKHRSQGESKKAFTAKELEAFGLKKA